MSLDKSLEKILIIDFGSQFTQLIARRIRELGVFCEIISHKKIKNKDINLGQFRIYEGDFPDKLWSARQQYQNMFEIPILFYLLCSLNIIFNNYSQFDIILSWGFVFSRIIHFFIRLKNQKDINIIPRTIVFVLGLLFLSIGWINFLLRYI